MRKILLMGLFLSSTHTLLAQSFTQDNLVVYRYGDGAAALADKTVAVFLDEYQTTAASAGNAVKVQTKNVPTTTAGANLRLTGLPRGSTNYVIEGYTTLSEDGTSLTIMGHDQVTGSGATSSVAKVIGLVDAAGTINTTTSVLAADVSNPRGAVTNGSGFWVSPPTGGTGVRYITKGTTTTNTKVATTPTSVRSMYIFGGQLYAASGTNAFYTIGTGLPTTSTGNTVTTTVLSGCISNTQMLFFDLDATVSGPDVLYVIDDNGGTDATSSGSILRKYTTANGTSWAAAGTVQVAGVTTNLQSITGKLVGNDIVLYAVTWGLPSGAISSLLKIVDTDAATSTINATANAPFVLANAPANTQFRSVTFTPGTSTLPIELTSFDAQSENSGVKLFWSSASEKNNSHYEVLRSVDGKTFNKIASINGAGTTDKTSNFSYLDSKPLSGINYYKLKQVDFNGQSSESKIVGINFTLQTFPFTVVQLDNALSISAYADKEGKTDLIVTNMNGQSVYSKKLSFVRGLNSVASEKLSLPTGIYIAILPAYNLRTKFFIK